MRKELPEHWCIRWETKEIYEVVNRFFGHYWHWTSNAIVGFDGKYYSNVKTPPRGLTLISYEEFKHFVLEQPVETVEKKKKDNYKWLIPILKKYNIK